MLAPVHEQAKKAQYRCIFCIFSHERAGIFYGHDALFEHIIDHAGAQLNGVKLEGPLSFSNAGLSVCGDFDINLPEPSSAVAVRTHESMYSTGPILDAEVQHEFDKLEIDSKRLSHTSEETDPYYCPWD